MDIQDMLHDLILKESRKSYILWYQTAVKTIEKLHSNGTEDVSIIIKALKEAIGQDNLDKLNNV